MSRCRSPDERRGVRVRRRCGPVVAIPWGLVLTPLGFVLLLALLAAVGVVAVPVVALLNRRRSSDDR